MQKNVLKMQRIVCKKCENTCVRNAKNVVKMWKIVRKKCKIKMSLKCKKCS